MSLPIHFHQGCHPAVPSGTHPRRPSTILQPPKGQNLPCMSCDRDRHVRTRRRSQLLESRHQHGSIKWQMLLWH